MPLELRWFGLLTLCAICMAWVSVRAESDQEGNGMVWSIVSMGVELMAVVISWENTGDPLMKWISHALPQDNPDLALLTTVVLTALICVVFVVALWLGSTMGFDMLQQHAERNDATEEHQAKPRDIVRTLRIIK